MEFHTWSNYIEFIHCLSGFPTAGSCFPFIYSFLLVFPEVSSWYLQHTAVMLSPHIPGPLAFQSTYEWFVNRMYANLHIAAPCYQLLIAIMLLVHYQKSLLTAFGSFQVTVLLCRNRSSLGAELELGRKLFQLPYFWIIPVSTLASRSCTDSSMQLNKILMTTKEWFVHIYSLLRILGQNRAIDKIIRLHIQVMNISIALVKFIYLLQK